MPVKKDLNPSPKVPEGTYKEETVSAVLGVTYGELSPNPKLKTEYVDGGHGIGQPTNPNNPARVQEEKKPESAYNFYDLTPYGDISSGYLNITYDELFKLIDVTYNPNKPTTVKLLYNQDIITLNDTVEHDKNNNVYIFTSGGIIPNDIGTVITFSAEKDITDLVIVRYGEI